MNKSLALEFSVKTANLCRHLQNEKDEKIISPALFAAATRLSLFAYSTNPALSKAELSAMRKDAHLAADQAALYLDMLFESGFISDAQRQSVAKTLTTLLKEIN
ncbi:MAG: hypothetical protein LUG52_05305 [Clostridia bacterium]|nr:hypothetical protein [Clostridia bacterium]